MQKVSYVTFVHFFILSRRKAWYFLLKYCHFALTDVIDCVLEIVIVILFRSLNKYEYSKKCC